MNKILAFHRPDAWKRDTVYSVWEDGEITLEKGGSLFGQRIMHTITSGGFKSLPVADFPEKNYDATHGRIFVASYAEAESVRTLILEMAT